MFEKVASDPVPIPQEATERVLELLSTGRLFRYGEDTGGKSDVALLEDEFAAFTGRKFALGVNSCGCSLFLSLKALGVEPGDEVLCNAFTLAPVPGAIAHANATAVFVEIEEDLTVDLDDLEAKLQRRSARVFLLSHMRGHFGDVARIADLCRQYDVRLIEDCAHTLGAFWADRSVGSYGDIACFSSQTFKHMNSGEGGLLVCDDPDIAARAILMSGSYMLYAQNGARPPLDAFEDLRDATPNFSMRMNNLTAALLRPQLPMVAGWTSEWNERYRWLEDALRPVEGIGIIERGRDEKFVGSSIQFTVKDLPPDHLAAFVEDAARHGVFLKWFGNPRTAGFTSRYDQWDYAGRGQALPNTDRHLAGLMDMRVALTFSEADCAMIAEVLAQSLEAVKCQIIQRLENSETTTGD